MSVEDRYKGEGVLPSLIKGSITNLPKFKEGSEPKIIPNHSQILRLEYIVCKKILEETEKMDFTVYTQNIGPQNCNGRLKYLYNKRDDISKAISIAISCNDEIYTHKLEKRYEEVCNVIEKLVEFRRHNECLLEGDPGYQPCYGGENE